MNAPAPDGPGLPRLAPSVKIIVLLPIDSIINRLSFRHLFLCFSLRLEALPYLDVEGRLGFRSIQSEQYLESVCLTSRELKIPGLPPALTLFLSYYYYYYFYHRECNQLLAEPGQF